MDIIDDLFETDTNNKENNKQKNNNWNEQSKKRKEAYKKIESMSFKITKSEDEFKQYLNILSKFERYSVGNCLLILEKEPNALQIKSKQDWKEKGYELIDKANEIIILEPYKVNDITYYNPKEEFDVSQTNAPIPEEKNYTPKCIARALLDECKAERKVVDILPNGEKGSQYVQKENVIYICRGLKEEYLLKTLIQEIAKIETKVMEDGIMKEFKTYCVSYMICKKYGLDILGFDFSNLPHGLANQGKSQAIRKELEDIRKNFIDVDNNIKAFFEKQSRQMEKQSKNQEQGR